MRVFEFHFNPKSKEDVLFDSFCYDPANIDERKLGNLYTIGEIRNTLPQNYKLLEHLSVQIKKEYYLSSLRSPEKALTEGLKKGNEFLEGLTKKGDVSWLGNLNFAVLSIKDFVFRFTKVEKIFFYFIRGGRVINITQKLIQEEINPYPLKVFGNIVSGKLSSDDILLVLTKEVADFFTAEHLFNEIASLNVFTEKKLKEILGLRDKELKEISGAALLISLTNETEKSPKGKTPQVMKFDRPKERFSITEALSPLLKILKWLLKLLWRTIRLIPRPSFNLKIPTLKINISQPKIHIFKPNNKFRNNAIIIASFAIILFTGFYLFHLQENKSISKTSQAMQALQNKNMQAQQLLAAGDKKSAGVLFLEAWDSLINLEKAIPERQKNSDFKKIDASLKDDLEKYLSQINNIKIIDNPELIFDFSKLKPQGNEQAFAPQNMVKMGAKMYFFNPAIQNIFDFDLNAKIGQIINKEQKFSFGFPLNSETLMFFAKPDHITYFKEPNQFTDSKIQFPNGDLNLIDFKINFSNLYFLDSKQNEIFKCPYGYALQTQSCQYWFAKNNAKKPTDSVSFALDGNVWVLSQNGEINRYWSGAYQETLKINFFPRLEKPTKIYTIPGIPYLYILEPKNNRILVFTKTGELAEQLQSKSFDNIKDIVVSNDGKIIYLLNGLSLYKINF